jgi:anti-sigma factor RsiW
MNCREARQHLMLYLDSEGGSELHFRISDHLGMCPDCAAWFAAEERFERALTRRLAEGEATPDLWGRALARAGVRPPASRRRRFALAALAAAALVLLGSLAVLRLTGPAHSSELAPLAADWHQQVLDGDVRPEFASTSDQEVDRYLKEKVPFRVHCPPRSDVKFAVRGAGVTLLKGQRQAAYIVGSVDEAPVSILVLDRSSLDLFPHERAQLKGGRHHRCREGRYQMVSGIVADNVVVVVGAAAPERLEQLLNAYGTYPEG